MSVVYVLLPAALLFAGAAVAVFIWAVRSGQYDDLVTPAHRILPDDEPKDGTAESLPESKDAAPRS